jgi:Ca-activated chloride channel family protein
MLHFAQPLWLVAGTITCLAATLFILLNIVRRKKELQQFASPHLLAGLTRNVSMPRRRMKNILLVLGLVCLFVALARPQLGNRWVEVKRKGIDILIGVDVSKSMLARDINPNRLERAKLAIRDFVVRLEGDRIGLLPFAGTSFLMCPLTTDYDAFNASLDALDVNTIPKGGTDIGAAIREADNILTNEANHKIFVLVTDGEDLSENGLKAAEEAKAQKMIVYTIGVGTPKGELVPQPGDASGKFIKDRDGNFITSRLDEKTLAKIADATDGLYVPLGNMGQGFDIIYRQKLAIVPKEVHGERKRKVPIERFPWPLGAAILLLSADFLITGRKSKWALRLPFVKTAGRRQQQQTAVLTLLLLSMAWSPAGQASEGEELFNNGNYEQSIQYYLEQLKKKPDDPTLHYNLGGALYRNKKYKEAASEFNNGLKTEDLSLQAKNYYNRGNAQFFLGAGTEKTDPGQTIKLWQQSLKSYQAALALQPEDEEAAHNRKVVEKKLEQLKKQEQKKKDKQKEKKNNKEKKENKDNKDNKGNKGNKSQQQDKQKQPQDSSRKKQQQKKGDNSKKQAEKQGDENNRKTTGSKEQKDQQQVQKQDTTGNTAGQQQSNKDKSGQQGREMSKQDMARKLEGKMTREEAKNLLESLKGEQSELNFIPQGSGSADNEGRDW